MNDSIDKEIINKYEKKTLSALDEIKELINEVRSIAL